MLSSKSTSCSLWSPLVITSFTVLLLLFTNLSLLDDISSSSYFFINSSSMLFKELMNCSFSLSLQLVVQSWNNLIRHWNRLGGRLFSSVLKLSKLGSIPLIEVLAANLLSKIGRKSYLCISLHSWNHWFRYRSWDWNVGVKSLLADPIVMCVYCYWSWTWTWNVSQLECFWHQAL